MGDATAFNDMVNVGQVARLLNEYGYHKHGNEIMYNGFSGRKLRTQVCSETQCIIIIIT